MCGIFAAVSLSKSFNEGEIQNFANALKIISHRGPDASDLKLYDSLDIKNNICLGHNRLSIIDLSSDGNQPFTNDPNYHIVFNGEIYNYLELKENYLKDYSFQTKTDTEVLLNLYRKFGTTKFGEMNGMWAFVLFDKIKNQIIVCRDRFSVKPLYFTFQNDTYYFGSEIKQLLPFINKKSINNEILGNYLYNYIIDYDDHTFFNEVKKIPARAFTILDIKEKTFKSEKYWNYTYEDLSHRKDSELNEEFYHLFTDAVKIRLRSDVKVGNTLSGGLDSSSIAVIADKISNEPLTNISVINKHKDFSEEKFVDILASHSRLSIKKINADSTNLWHGVKKAIWHNDEPILSLSTVAHFNMMQLFKEQTDITVILSGQGGDETLAGYNKFLFFNLKSLVSEKKYFSAIKEGGYILPKLFGELKLNHAKRYLNYIEKSNSFIDNVININFEHKFSTNAKTLRDRQIADIDKFSVPALTHYEDRSSMSQSLEIRLPFLDFRLVNFNLNLPIEKKIKNGFTKNILRQSITELPQQIAWRKDKKGFTLDEKSYYTTEVIEDIKNLFNGSKLSKLGFLNDNTFISEFNNYLCGKKNYWERDINRVIFAELWLKIYFEDL